MVPNRFLGVNFKKLITLLSANGLAVLIVSLTTFVIAGALGPRDFGVFAFSQAVAAVLMPMVMGRFETRILLAKNDVELSDIYQACVTISAMSALVGLGVFAAAFLFDLAFYKIGFFGFVIAIGSGLTEASIYLKAHKGRTKTVAGLRFARAVFPGGLACVSVLIFPEGLNACLASYALAIFMVAAFSLASTKVPHLSFAAIRLVLGKNKKGIVSAFLLGLLNAIWLNTMLPIMQFLGMDQVAGQYAIAQRLINSPLLIVGAAVSMMLLDSRDQTHVSKRNILKIVGGCFCMGVLYSGLLFYGLYSQPWIPVPQKWLMDVDLFLAVSFFLVSSFSVGSASSIAIKQKDEGFILYWQLLFLLFYFGVIFLCPDKNGMLLVLVFGGGAYWFLLARWLWLAPRRPM